MVKLNQLKSQFIKHIVNLNVISTSPHTSAVITGFLMLSEQGIIDLKINLLYDKVQDYPTPHLVEAIIGKKRIAFDTLDGYNWNVNTVEDYLNNIDFYFKRSFSDEKNKTLSEKNRSKICPLGFNYHLSHKKNPNDGRKNLIKELIRICLGRKGNSYFTPNKFEAPADNKDNNLKILFFTRLWEPDTNNGLLDKEREYINQMRISIIRKLKQLYPENFIGGVQNSAYAKKMCEDIIMPDKYTIRQNYLKLVKQSDICIGSMGLHESIGWKTGEYVAASRAIVNERLHYKVTGDFDIGKNYLSFDNEDECVNHISYLIQNPDMVYAMKKENEKYYHSFLRPDKQILNTLKIVLKKE